MFFPYESHGRGATAVRVFGVRPDRDGVMIDDDDFVATFGFLHLRTPIDNIVSSAPSGPYQWIKSIGPRLSIADHGLTFGTTNRAGVCVMFAQPIPRVIGPWNHPGLTVTVREPEALCNALAARS